MAALSTLELLREQAEQARDQALAALSEAQARLSRAQAQADDLRGYQGQYHERWQGQARQGLGMETLLCYQSYGTRLTEAIGQQGQLIQTLEQRWEVARAELQERELRLASLRKLIERRQAELQLLAHRQEQKLNDEWAARSARGPSN